jgi:cytochrome c biogenesis protein CcdA/glutaredoxin
MGNRAAIAFLLLAVSLSSAFNVYYFYGYGCPHCANTEPFLEQMQAKYPQMNLTKLETWENADNAALLNSMYDYYNVSKDPGERGVPVVFVENAYLRGDKPIIDGLEPYLQQCSRQACCDPLVAANASCPPASAAPSLFAIVSLALVDSINPCAFAVLIFLLSYITSIGNTKRAITVALIYIAAVFVSYFAAGMGISMLTDLFVPFRHVIALGVGTFAVLAGLVNIKDFFFYGKWFSLEIPKGMKPTIEKYSHNTTLVGAVVLGFLVSAVELPCTGFAYLAAVGILTRYSLAERIPWLLLYNLVFVLPLFIIIVLYYKGLSAEAMENWRESEKKWMKLAMGIVLVAVGAALALGII